jgi:NTE family protein
MTQTDRQVLEEPTPPDDPGERDRGRRKGLALCLSGGGYRATLFHLGAVRRLHEVGLLERLTTISSVSGGSVFAGVLANVAISNGWNGGLAITDFDAQVAEPVRRLARRDFRTVPFLLHAPWNWLAPGLRARHLERLCRKHISGARIEHLPEQPRFVFCATDITFGVSWESSRARTGSYRAGYLADGAQWPIARAVAASACFPPIFGPFPVKAGTDGFRGKGVRGATSDAMRKRLALSDGGVYDNMGLEPVWKTHACVLVSDCGAPFEFHAGGNAVRRLLRYTTVVTNQAQSVRRRSFFADVNGHVYDGAYWAISTTGGSGYRAELIEERIARIRTDLDPFTPAEQAVLENHGYWVAEQRLRERVPQLLAATAPDASAPHADWMDEARVRTALRASARRFSVRRIVLRR